MLALNGGCANWCQLFSRKMPRPARQPIFAAAAVRDALDGAPVIAPFRCRELLDRTYLTHGDFGFVELGVEGRHIRKGQDPGLDDLMQRAEIQATRGSAGEPRI